MKEPFIDINFSAKRLLLIEEVNEILEEYEAMGYDLTVRQVYYQLVAAGKIPNNMRSYKRLAKAVSDGRKTGLIDWDMIVDRTRETVIPPHWSSPASIVYAAARSFAIDKWEDQPNHIEVMVEKEALAGILKPVCTRLDINFTANKGYSSDSAMYLAGKRIYDKVEYEDKEVYIAYLGDHDPSGMDMDRDILDRLQMFSASGIGVDRLALLMEQIDKMDIPENPAKTTDSRSKAYIVKFGGSSWELDAVRPQELERLVEEFVIDLRDDDLWEDAVERENEMKKELKDFADNYD